MANRDIEAFYWQIGVEWLEPVMRPTKYLAFDGFFGDAKRPDMQGGIPELKGEEIGIARTIRETLDTQGHTAMVDVGGMLSGSMAVLAAYFALEVDSGNLALVTINRESDASFENLLAEAKRRLDMYGEEGYTEIWRRAPVLLGDMDGEGAQVTGFHSTQPWVSRPVLEFISSQAGRVKYIAGVDTTELPQIAASLSIPRFDVVHEDLGGLMWHPNKPDALRCVVQTLNTGGVIVTTQRLEEDKYYPINEEVGIACVDYKGWRPQGYRWYRPSRT